MPLRKLLPFLPFFCLGAPAQAQAPQPAAAVAAEATGVLPYTVELVPSGDDTRDSALRQASQLLALQTTAPTGAIGIMGRAEGDRDRLAQALQSLGYWAGAVSISIGGETLGSPGLLQRLEAQRGPVTVQITAEPGPLFTIERIAIEPAVAADTALFAGVTARPLPIAAGDPAAAAPILAAEAALLERLRRAGHPLASVVARDTLVDFDRKAMAITWRIAAGPLAHFAQPRVQGQQRVDSAFLERIAGRITGETYSPERLERARRDLAALGVFESVRVQPGTRLDAQGALPSTFIVSERPRHAAGISGAYETNYGPTARVYWEHRNLFGGAERLRLEAEVARIGTGGDLSSMTYRIGATLRDPGILGRDLNLISSLFAVRERLPAWDRDAIAASALVEKRYSEQFSALAGPVGEFGQIGPHDGPLRPYQVVGLQTGGRLDTTDSLLNPSRGVRVNGTITPSYSLGDGSTFAPMRVTASTYWDVLGDQGSILALRGSFGSLLSPGTFHVPENQRFFAGGGGSVRGYDYQSIGPRNAAGKPVGGASLVEGSIEWRQRITDSYGFAAFVDAGTVGHDMMPNFSDLRVGAGLGFRYLTPIGPIRADVAVPLVKQQGSSGYGLYIGIGQAF